MFANRVCSAIRRRNISSPSTSLNRMISARFASNFSIFDDFNQHLVERVETPVEHSWQNTELIQLQLAHLALNESEFVTPAIDINMFGVTNVNDIIPMLMINILKRRRKKMNKHKWKKLKRRVRNSTKYNPERRRKMKQEKRKRYLIKNGLLAPDSNFGL